METAKPKFDPSKPSTPVAKPRFDPSKPSTAVAVSAVPGIPNIVPPEAAAEPGYSGITPKDVWNFAPAFSENIPIGGGLATAGGERFGAALKYLTDKATGEETTYDEALKAIQAENERTRAKRLEESPMTVGVVAPVAAAAAVPTPFGKTEGLAGALGRIGGNVALTAADDLARGDVEGVPLDAGIVGGIQTAIEAAPLAKRTALSRALKAAFGQQKRAFTETAKQAGKLEKTGEALLQADEAGPAVVKLFSTPEDIAPRAKAKKEFFGKEIERVGTAIDSVVPESVSGPAIAEKIRAELDNIAVNKETEAVRGRLTDLVNEFWEMGDMSFKAAQKHKDSFKFKAPDGSAQVLPADVKTKVKMAIGEVMDDTVATVAKANGSPELAERYAKAKEGYGVYKPVAKFAEDRALADRAARALSPSDLYAAGTLGTGAFLGSMISGNNTGESGGLSTSAALLGAGVNNLVRRRGSAASAVTAKFISDMLQRQPALFGRFKGQLANAEKRGSTALMMTHEALLESPEYGAVMNALSGALGSDDGDVAVINDPALLEGYRQSITSNREMPSTAKAKALNDLNQNGYYEMDLTPYRQEFERQMIPAPLEMPPSFEGLTQALRSSLGKQSRPG